jgi:hypothetical protein
LTTQSIQAQAALALVCVLVEDSAGASEAAEQAAALSQQSSYPIGEAAALEARGIVGDVPDALDTLREAAAAWEQLGRRLDAARCEQLLGRRLKSVDSAAAGEALAQAAATYDELGIRHLAEQARVLVKV